MTGGTGAAGAADGTAASAASGAADADASGADASGADASGAAESTDAERRAEARRRRRIDEVFGDVLPVTTEDEREPGRRGGFSLEHYRASRPPHWGDKQ